MSAQEANTLIRNHMSQAIKLDPNIPLVLAMDAKTSFSEGNYQKGLDKIGILVEKYPSDTRILNQLSNMLLTVGHIEESIQVNDRSIELDPLNVGAYAQTGTTFLYFTDRTDEARLAFEKMEELGD